MKIYYMSELKKCMRPFTDLRFSHNMYVSDHRILSRRKLSLGPFEANTH